MLAACTVSNTAASSAWQALAARSRIAASPFQPAFGKGAVGRGKPSGEVTRPFS
jgi:hypothetical protein